MNEKMRGRKKFRRWEKNRKEGKKEGKERRRQMGKGMSVVKDAERRRRRSSVEGFE